MGRRERGGAGLAAAVLVMLAGCTGGGGTSTPTIPSSAPSASAPSSSTASSTPAGTPSSTSSVLVSGADCLPGTWRLVRFVGLGQQATYGTGQGGDVHVTFDDGRYNLVGEGSG